VDLVDRAGHLKPMLVDFALSPRFDRELPAAIARSFPGGVVTDESVFSMVLDHFTLQHRLPSGNTVVEAFIAAHPELTDAERDMLLGWRDVVEGIFDIAGKDRDALVLFNLLDELTYRARSNLGRRAFKPLKKGMILVGRLVRAGEDWMVSGNPAAFPASARDQMLAAAAEQAMRSPEAVFRNPANWPRPAASLPGIMTRSRTCSAPTSSSSPAPRYPARSRRSTATWPSRPAPAPDPSSPLWTSPTTCSPPTASRSTSPRAKD
jgi:hypothetical protein